MHHQSKYEATFFGSSDAAEWDALATASKNASFLFCRGFMDYHSDRFDDCSVVVRKDGKMVAGLPANRIENTIFSHGGLTYGGFFYTDALLIHEVFDAFSATLRLLHENGIESLNIKPIPALYHKMPSDELLQALFAAKADLTDRETLLVIDRDFRIPIPKKRRQGITRGKRSGLDIREDGDFEAFWNRILIPNLQERYGVGPVHSLDEIRLLHARFPTQIRQFNVYEKGEIVGGTTVFDSERVAHPQYLSAHGDRNRSGAVDFLYDYLINEAFAHKKYFDLGTSSLKGGKMSAGLLFWKQQFGGRGIVQDRYLVRTGNHELLKNIFI